MNILITGGGCKEMIDGVRCITNISTGMTSSFIADYLASKGNSVTAIMAKDAVHPKSCTVLNFTTGEELSSLLKEELSSNSYDMAIHAAAVSDFIPVAITVDGKIFKAGKDAKKIPSGSNISIALKPSQKIAKNLKSWSCIGNKACTTKIVCYKLTNNATEEEKTEAVRKLFATNGIDYIISNDVSEISATGHKYKIYCRDIQNSPVTDICSQGGTVKEMAESINRLL